MDRIGVRELRQHASRYLARVTLGESIEVTDRGRPVARLVPIVEDPWTDLVTSGRVTVAIDTGDIAEEAPVHYDVDASANLEAMRAGEQ
jgi:prevent-host-death family protein